MEKPRINKTKAKKIILQQLEKGLTHGDTYRVILGNFRLSEPTFDTYWKECQQEYIERLNRLEQKKDEVRLEAEKEALKYRILSRYERMEIASRIALGEERDIVLETDGEGNPIKKGKIVPSDNERTRALDYLSKIEGDYAPEKMEVDSKHIIVQRKVVKRG